MLPDVYKQCDYMRITFEISSVSLGMRVKCFPCNYSIWKLKVRIVWIKDRVIILSLTEQFLRLSWNTLILIKRYRYILAQPITWEFILTIGVFIYVFGREEFQNQVRVPTCFASETAVSGNVAVELRVPSKLLALPMDFGEWQFINPGGFHIRLVNVMR